MKGKVNVREYHDSDLDCCRSLWSELVECHREIYADSSIGGDKPFSFFDKHLARIGAGQIWVAEVDGLVVGSLGLEIKNEEAELEPIVVE